MGQLEIIEKLNRELGKDIKEECQVVYILSRIRKILEIKEQKKKYKFLNFYSNWALHSKLDHENTTAFLASLLEQDIDNAESGRDIAIKIKTNNGDFFKLSLIKQEMDKFSKEYNISSVKNWNYFMKLILDIIKECPIEFNSCVLKKLELKEEKRGEYCYRLDLLNSRHKPKIKLKFR